ncbi:MAG: DUF4258 domain-containing protein [Candidatus Magnetominusculus sp. LBB02]|nr:DUF4258 domain-containing protein [Candidatus Magnetominusculus sp. LBB02]
MSTLQRIRQKVIDKDYYISSHAEDEMFDDGLERQDIENIILKGRIERRLLTDIRGTRYRIEGLSLKGETVHVICRFKDDNSLVIITAYVVMEGI